MSEVERMAKVLSSGKYSRIKAPFSPFFSTLFVADANGFIADFQRFFGNAFLFLRR